MSKIVKNNTACVLPIPDTGICIPACCQHTITAGEDFLFASSNDLVTVLGGGCATINDGTSDLSNSDGLDLIKGIFPKKIQITDGCDDAEVLTRGDGKKALAIDGQFSVSICELLGLDPLPDTYLTICAAGAACDTIRVQVAATTSDTTTPDCDVPAVDETYTLVAGDVGDELQLRDNLATFLNGTCAFSNAFLKAVAIKDRPIVQITSTVFSLGGEFYERNCACDVQITTTGTTTVTLRANEGDKLKARQKVVSLARDPCNPHDLGVLGISGSIAVNPGGITNFFSQNALNCCSNNLLVNGACCNVMFTICADCTLDTFITTLHFNVVASGTIKFSQFLARNVSLTNGVLVSFFTEEGQKDLDAIKNTEDFDSEFALGSAQDFTLYDTPSASKLKATFKPELSAIKLRAGTTDRIEVTIRDDLTPISIASSFIFKGVGFRKEP